jgi:hypothetical protein
MTKFNAWEQTDHEVSRRITQESSRIANQSINFEETTFAEMHIQCRAIKTEMNWSRFAGITPLAMPGRQRTLRASFSCFRIWWGCSCFVQISALCIKDNSILGILIDPSDQSSIITTFPFRKSSSIKPHYPVTNTFDFCDLPFLFSPFLVRF